MKFRDFSPKVVEWYLEHHRNLPWRKTRDPYRIWLSEIILQQTRVLQGLPYFEEFVRRYPSVQSLAAAKERDVLRLWQGLGYYSRARNLHKCAKVVTQVFQGHFPADVDSLRELPGIGDYTAAAIASMAFDVPVAVVDGNVYRVLSRIFGIRNDILSTRGKRTFAELANQLVPNVGPGLHNQAIMEFGALFCTPRNPRCTECPFQRTCIALKDSSQHTLPVKRKKKKPSSRYFYYFVVEEASKLRMKERRGRDIWTGLFDFPLYESSKPLKEKELIKYLPASRKRNTNPSEGHFISSTYRHVLTHQIIHARFIQLPGGSTKSVLLRSTLKDSSMFTKKEVMSLPKPVLIGKYLHDIGYQ